jgi:agmatine deiminase
MAKRMPAEWEAHEATWLAWPHEKTDWLTAFPKVKEAYLGIVKTLSAHERVEILCSNSRVYEEAMDCLSGISNFRLHLVENDRCWLRDSGPTSVMTDAGEVSWIRWGFNAWAKYENYSKDSEVAEAIINISELEHLDGVDEQGALVTLEGGAIDSDGQGTLLLTEECLLSSVQQRNHHLDRAGYERVFREHLGIESCIWLGCGVPGDDTHGHIDGVCRFVAPGRVVLCAPGKGRPDYVDVYQDNLRRLKQSRNAQGVVLEVIDIPLPEKLYYEDQLLPASYANFYIANNVVLVPVFDDPNDDQALSIFNSLFPDREVVGIYCGDLIVGMGAIHCITQPQFSPK